MSEEFNFRSTIQKDAPARELRRAAESPDTIDLEPRRWRSDRPKPREPIFGLGALPLLGELIGLAFALLLLIAIAYLATEAKKMMYGAPEQSGVTSNGIHWHVN
jgi:hypothetical protein